MFVEKISFDENASVLLKKIKNIRAMLYNDEDMAKKSLRQQNLLNVNIKKFNFLGEKNRRSDGFDSSTNLLNKIKSLKKSTY